MEIIIPHAAELKKTGAAPVYIYPLWQDNTYYARGTRVRKTFSGISYDYSAYRSHTSSTWNAPYYFPYWDEIGVSGVTGGYTYTTSVRLSNSPTWTTGAVSEGSVVFDPADLHDYRALVAIASGNNTLRPSEAKQSSNAEIAAQWLDLGSANAFAPLDYSSNSYLTGYNYAGQTLASVTFTVAVAAAESIDRISFAGLSSVQTVAIVVTVGGAAHHSASASLIPPGTSYGRVLRTKNFAIPTIAAGSSVEIAVTLTQLTGGLPPRLSIMMVGRALTLAGTEWGVESSILGFSTKERDETFGTVRFVKRGSARQIKATCFVDLSVISGDVIQQVLSEIEGVPVYWDFNGGGSDYDRLRVFGYFSNMRTILQGSTYESLVLDVEGLAE